MHLDEQHWLSFPIYYFRSSPTFIPGLPYVSAALATVKTHLGRYAGSPASPVTPYLNHTCTAATTDPVSRLLLEESLQVRPRVSLITGSMLKLQLLDLLCRSIPSYSSFLDPGRQCADSLVSFTLAAMPRRNRQRKSSKSHSSFSSIGIFRNTLNSLEYSSLTESHPGCSI